MSASRVFFFQMSRGHILRCVTALWLNAASSMKMPNALLCFCPFNTIDKPTDRDWIVRISGGSVDLLFAYGFVYRLTDSYVTHIGQGINSNRTNRRFTGILEELIWVFFELLPETCRCQVEPKQRAHVDVCLCCWTFAVQCCYCNTAVCH